MLLNDADSCFERGNSKLALRSALTASPNAIIITHGSPVCFAPAPSCSTSARSHTLTAMSRFLWKRTVIALLVFGTAFGYLEAAVSSYLGQLYEPARQRFYPGRSPSE